ncbi:MAG: methyltransferase type 12 [Jatrophihabitantaceae bacterium]|nr:methyltransferase type 12 [Jatrophihabitantaceae bacterium]
MTEEHDHTTHAGHAHEGPDHDSHEGHEGHEGHEHGNHEHGQDHGDQHKFGPEMFTADYWDDRYATKPSIWSGNPNQRLVEQASHLSPGTALEVGSGEGADAIWLAQRGWQVVATDVSSVALERAAGIAAAAGSDVAERITWQLADLLEWVPAPATYDLVSAHFMYLPQPGMRTLHERLAAAVRPGGTLLVVGHDPSDLHRIPRDPGMAAIMYTAEDVAAVLNRDQWDIEVCEVQARVQTGPDGVAMDLNDAVLRARRR